jgi:hypothetical protein
MIGAIKFKALYTLLITVQNSAISWGRYEPSALVLLSSGVA